MTAASATCVEVWAASTLKAKTFPGWLPALDAMLRGMIVVELILQDREVCRAVRGREKVERFDV